MDEDHFIWQGGAHLRMRHHEPGLIDIVESEMRRKDVGWPSAKLVMTGSHIDIDWPGDTWRFRKNQLEVVRFDVKHGRRDTLFLKQRHGVMVYKAFWWPTCFGIFRQAARWRLRVISHALMDLGYEVIW
jgi:hypothetical protein